MPGSDSTSNLSNTEAPRDADVSGENSQLPVLDIAIQLLGHRWQIAKVAGAFILAGAILCLLLPRRYTATAKIMPPQQSQSGLSVMASQLLSSTGAGSIAALTGGGLGLKNPNDTYIGILESRLIADDRFRQAM